MNVPTVTKNDVGGLENVKRELQGLDIDVASEEEFSKMNYGVMYCNMVQERVYTILTKTTELSNEELDTLLNKEKDLARGFLVGKSAANTHSSDKSGRVDIVQNMLSKLEADCWAENTSKLESTWTWSSPV